MLIGALVGLCVSGFEKLMDFLRENTFDKLPVEYGWPLATLPLLGGGIVMVFKGVLVHFGPTNSELANEVEEVFQRSLEHFRRHYE